MSFKASLNRFFSNKYMALAITLIIFVLCTLPSKEIPLSGGFNDKTAHFLAFGAWAFCWQAAFGRYMQTIIAGILYGIFIEFWQSILPESFHRSFDWYDAVADGVGVLIGILLWKIKSLLHL